jgi:DNA-binding SARP family transcriptional activator
VEFRILGPLEIIDGERVLPLGGPKRRAVVAVLLLDANRVVASERLIDLVWGGDPPAAALGSLQNHVLRLRRELGDRLVTRPPGYLLRVERGELDLDRFRSLVDQARAGEPREAATLLHEALALWRGDPLADLAGEPAGAAAAHLAELRLEALESRIDADLALGRHAILVPELEALVGEHPFRERLRGQLMLALYRSGRQADALEAYAAARIALIEALGAEPGAQLQELQRAILRQDEAVAGRAAEAPVEPVPRIEEARKTVTVVLAELPTRPRPTPRRVATTFASGAKRRSLRSGRTGARPGARPTAACSASSAFPPRARTMLCAPSARRASCAPVGWSAARASRPATSSPAIPARAGPASPARRSRRRTVFWRPLQRTRCSSASERGGSYATR